MLYFVLAFLLQIPEPQRFLPTLAPEATIALEAAWDPCRRSKYGLFHQTEVLRVPKAAELRHTYGATELAPFLPAHAVAVGDTWPVSAEAVIPFLRQFHPGARSELHSTDDEGAFACLRAASGERFEILIRAHAEFQLTPDVVYTPAQFEGRLVLERAKRVPLALTIALPDRDTNVDVNVTIDGQLVSGDPEGSVLLFPGQRFTAADIGWVPRMELASASAASSLTDPAVASASSIPDAEARARLARRFYPMARLEWPPFGEAFVRARERDKPLLVIVLFGTLDDESC